MTILFSNLALAYDLKEYYPLGQGNSWTYSAIDITEVSEETVRIEGKELIDGLETVRMQYVDDGYSCIAYDHEGIKEYKDFEENYSEFFNPPLIVFPNIEIGESKSYLVDSIIYDIDSEKIAESTSTIQISLESVEDVKVPANIFTDCLRFSKISEWRKSDGSFGTDKCVIWLARGVGRIKEFCIYRYRMPGSETTEISTSSVIYKLISAVVDGKKIGD